MSKQKLRIGVLMGGPSAEREISLITGRAVTENLDNQKYEIIPIEMSKDGKMILLNSGDLKSIKYGDKKQQESFSITTSQDNYNLSATKLDLIFIALHGTYGEDGCLQGLLECLNVPYTGSRVLASALAMNKAKTAEIYRAHGLLTPDFIDFQKIEWLKDKKQLIKEIIKKIGFPVVIKPVDQGSAVGVSIVNTEKEMVKIIESTFKNFSYLMAQKFVKGKEATCGVLEKNGIPFALPPTRIIANKGKFYDYKSKYDEGGSTHICPADFSPTVNKKLQVIAVKAHQVLGCRGMSRTDIFVADDGNFYVIETNTIPGMTAVSLLPEAAGKMGISFNKMLDLIIEASLKF